LRDALVTLTDSGEVPSAVRAEIGESWARSLDKGLHPDRFDVPFLSDPDTESAPMRSASVVLSGVAEDLEGTPVGLLLTDSRGQVVARWASGRRLRADFDNISLAPGFDYSETAVGTNAIGAALVRRAPTFVAGQEHFADVLTQMACGAAPFSDPATGRLLGVVDLTCRASDANPLLLTLARRGARDVVDRLTREVDGGERALWEHFLRLRRGVKGPLVVVNQRRALYNAAADHLVRTADGPALWEQALRGLARKDPGPSRLQLGSGVEVDASCEALWEGGELIGAALRIQRTTNEAQLGAVLTATERSVASLVAEGLTNRQVGERLFMSRFTVDSHLRSIYRKLGVASRSELAWAMSVSS
jgi:transcriptional regulator of acetoin/glycerol metabolism/DNA-binding CsgD family transcriptional regulator